MSSSRDVNITSAPDAPSYNAKPVPFEVEDLAPYINDELLSIGGLLNNVLSGGAVPPQTVLPERIKDGMLIYFTQPIVDSDITSSGLWFYKLNTWLKII